MATFVKGEAVPNASGYELLEKVGDVYNSLAEASEINFEVSAMDFAAGDHLLAVKAKGDGVNYSDSDPSDTVKYTVADKTGTELAYTLRQGYYNTNSNTVLPTSNPLTDLAGYVSTNMITRDQLPNGSKIVCADGWIYRPNGWESENAPSVSTARPDLVPAGTVVVDDNWWIAKNGTTEFAVIIFCIARAKADNPNSADSSNPLSATNDEAIIREAFKIIIPE